MDAKIAELRELLSAAAPKQEKVAVENGEVAGITEAGFNVTHEYNTGPLAGRPVPKERQRIYATADGEPRDVLVYRLSDYLKRRHPDGTPVFSMAPTKPYITGGIKCVFHADHPLRPTLDAIGLAGTETCPAANLASEFHARRHAEIKHSERWKTYKEHLARVEKDEERDRWAALLNATQGGRDPYKTTGETAGRIAAQHPDASDVQAHFCLAEGCTRFFDSDQGLRIHQAKEHRS